MISKAGLVVAVFALLVALVAGQPEGWKMTDRFYGFRFELSGNSMLDNDVLEAIQMEADNYACFGWVQLSEKGTVVGEARCSKARGKVLEGKIAKISTKIKDSKILVNDNITSQYSS
ncbi:hypothetical protein EON64_01045 [archaeon]|nr:MAG: hypothetical protein EON64_01045 [archaeon]